MGSCGPATLVTVLLAVTYASAYDWHTSIQAHRQAQALNGTLFTPGSRGTGLRRIQLSDEQIAALKARNDDHLVLIQALKQVRDIKRTLNISIDIPGFNTSSFVQLIKDRLAPLLANLTAAGDFNSTRLKDALNQAITLLMPNTTGKPPARSLLQSGTNDGSYPSSWDSRTTGLVSQVRDQGQCGTCAAFSTTSAMEGSIAQSKQQNALGLPQLSPQWLYFCAGLYPEIQCSGSNSGMNLDYVDEAIPNIGIQYDACFPYNPNAGKTTCGAPTANCSPLGPAGGWQELEFINVNMAYSPSSPILAQDLLNAKAHIRTYGGVVSGFFIDNAFQTYSGGTYQQSPPWQTSQGHAVEVIGYNDDANPPYWIAKNSWGTGWGDSGFFQIAYSGTALMTMDANGFIYSPSGTPSTGGTTTQSMVCYGIFYNQTGQTGDSFNVKSNPVTINSPAANYTYSDLSFVNSDTTGSSWVNNIRSYTLQCNCTNTGSCISLAQGMTFKYWPQVNLTGTVTNVNFTADNCDGANSCKINNNLFGNVGSMAVQWVPPTQGVIGAGAAPPPPPMAASLVSSSWMMTLVAGIAAMAMTMLLPHATTV